MNETESRFSLYSPPVLAAARSWANTEMPPDGAAVRVTVNNPFCGDRIVGWLEKRDEEYELGLSLDTCLICRASAHLLVEVWHQFERELSDDGQVILPKAVSTIAEIWANAPSGLSGEMTTLYWALRKLYDENTRRSCIELPWQALDLLMKKVASNHC